MVPWVAVGLQCRQEPSSSAHHTHTQTPRVRGVTVSWWCATPRHCGTKQTCWQRRCTDICALTCSSCQGEACTPPPPSPPSLPLDLLPSPSCFTLIYCGTSGPAAFGLVRIRPVIPAAGDNNSKHTHA